VLRKLALKNKALNKSNLINLNNSAHLGNFPKKLKTLNSDYENLELFIDDFEKYLETQIETPSLRLNSQDKIFEGIVNGTITWPMRGIDGHGYDPIFIPDGHKRTFGEMTNFEKNKISHRSIALKKFISFYMNRIN